jgi:hypothetical protein
MRTAIVMFMLLAAEARAETPEQLIDRGLTLRERGQDLEALALFEEAYAASRSAQALAQIGLAEQALGRWVEASRHVEQALATKDPWVMKREAPLLAALETIRDHVGELEVLGSPEGAAVILNGKEAGTLPLSEPVRVVAGTIVIAVTKPGFVPLSRTIEVHPRTLSRETFELVAEEVEPPVAAPPPPPVEKPVARVETSAPGLELTVWAYSAAGVAAAGLATGIAGTAVRAKHVANYNDDSMCLVGGRSREDNCGAERDKAKTGEALAIAGFTVAGVFAAGAVLLFVFDGADAAPIAYVIDGGAGAGIAGRF